MRRTWGVRQAYAWRKKNNLKSLYLVVPADWGGRGRSIEHVVRVPPSFLGQTHFPTTDEQMQHKIPMKVAH